jgi:site-specific DNA-methyltransferase (adenine-specific)
MIRNEIANLDCIEYMKTLPDRSINCIITSPPYWSQRDYGIEPSVWGGDLLCKHEWNTEISVHRNLAPSKQSANSIFHDPHNEEKRISDKIKSGFCSKCGAWLGVLGLEPDFNMYIKNLIIVFEHAKRILKNDGCLFVNIGDKAFSKTYSNRNGKDRNVSSVPEIERITELKNSNEYKEKCYIDLPFRFSLSMIDAGWIKRNTIIWKKTNNMPDSVKDRFTIDFEYVFFFTKNKNYYFEQQFIKANPESIKRQRRGRKKGKYAIDCYSEMGVNTICSKSRDNIGYEGIEAVINNHLGRNMGSVWNIATAGIRESHYAVFPEKLVLPLLLSGCPEYICNKCNKPRRKLFKARGGMIGNSFHDHSEDDIQGMSQSPSGLDKRGKEQYIKYFVGYSQCGCNEGYHRGLVYDPFCGAGTVPVVAKKNNRDFIGSELNPNYIKIAEKRLEITHCQLTLI